MKEKRKVTFGTILVFIGILMIIFVVSYSFFLPKIKEGQTYSQIGNGDNPITINFTDCLESNQSDCATISSDMIPGDSVTKTFKLSNNGQVDATSDMPVTIYFKRLLNTFVNSDTSNTSVTSDLRYTLTEIKTIGDNTTETVLASNESVPYNTEMMYNTPFIENITLKAGETRNYTLTITYLNYDSIDQESNRHATFLIELGVNTSYDNFGIDTSGANAPVLTNNLIPVIYDEDQAEWVVADTGQKSWYNYDKQIWANAVTIKEGYLTEDTNNIIEKRNAREYYNSAEPGTIVSMDDIIGMYVWIPRYEYKIEGTYGVQLDGGNTPSKATPGAITIKFVNKSQTKADKTYIMHPAFIDGSQNDFVYGGWDEEITGFWYGKFEASGSYNSSNYLGSSINVIPATSKKAVSSLRNMAIYHQFMAAKSVSSYQGLGSTLDSHMSKNDEWGAVSYLTQSKYGKYGNNLYTGTNKEVFINNYSSFYTGTSSGTPSAGQTSTLVVGNPITTNGTDSCYYDTLVDRGNGLGSCGGGASTTGNIYGVYDMNGGLWEYTMAYLEGTNGKTFDANVSASSTYQKNGEWGAASSGQSSAWSNAFYSEKLQGTNHKYYNAYTATNVTTACNGGVCYGHALSETVGWYGDDQSMISTDYPWFERSRDAADFSYAGLYVYNGWKGNAVNDLSFRVVLIPTSN